MEVTYTIVAELNAERRSILRELGVSVRALDAPNSVVRLTVSPSKHDVEQVLALARQWGARIESREKFDESDRKVAPWVLPGMAWGHDYEPLPKVQGWQTVSFIADCSRCFVGYGQIAPLRIAGEPKWESHSMLSLNGRWNEILVKPKLYRLVFEPFGVDFLPVHDPDGKTLKTVVQLVSKEDVDVEVEGLQTSVCTLCGTESYLPPRGGYAPTVLSDSSSHFVHSRQHFASGGGERLPYFSAELYARVSRDSSASDLAYGPTRPR